MYLLYDFLVGALMGGIGGSVEAINVYRDGRMKMAAEAIDRCCDAAEKTGVNSEETAIRAKEAENILALAGDEKSSPTGSGTEIYLEAGPSALESKTGVAHTLAKSIPSISDMQPVAALTGREMSGNGKRASERIADFFNRIGNSVERSGFGKVIFGEYGVGGMLNHRPLNRAKMVSLEAVPEVIRSGKLIAQSDNWKDRGYSSYVFAAPVTIAGEQVYVAAVVDKRPDNKFYLNECVDSEGNFVRIKEKPSDNTKSGVTVQDGVTAVPEGSTGSVAQNATEVKTAENGAESAQGATEVKGEETTRRESEKPRELTQEQQEEIKTKFLNYLLRGNATEEEINERLLQIRNKGAQESAGNILAQAMENGEVVERDGKYYKSDARKQTEQDFAREMELREAGVHGDTTWMKKTDADYLGQLAKAGDVSIEVVDTLGQAQGAYDPKTGRIQIAKDMEDPVGFVTQHELTHRMKQNSPEKWSEFLNYVQEQYGERWNDTVEQTRQRYAQSGIELTAEEAAEEVAADFAGSMDEKDIRRLTQENRSLAQKILDAIRSLIRKLKGGENQKLYEMEKLWADALKEGNKNTAQEGGVRYSLNAFEDGTRFVDVKTDQEQFDGLDEKAKTKLAIQMIKKRFAGRVIGIDNSVFVNGGTAAEYGHPAKNISPDIRNAKMRAATELDNLVDAGTNFRTRPDGADGHIHPEAVGDFRYFDTIFKVGDEYYRGTINIEPVAKGLLLKDVTKIENITQDISSSYGKSPKSTFLRDASMNSIAGNEAEVKAESSDGKKFSLKSYTEEEKQQHVKDAVAYFGRTYKWAETGYITTDGKRLDFSGRHEGGPGGYRTVDHRDIRDALGDDYGGDDYSGSMVQFMSEGNIRILPESGGIDLSVQPTKAQEEALSDFISKQRGEVILDMDTPDGQTVSSAEYPRGTHANKVLADIRAYFEDGTEPRVSEVSKYRYSLKGSKAMQDELYRLTMQNERIEQELDMLKQENRELTKKARMELPSSTDQEGVEKAARSMARKYGSKIDREALTMQMLRLYDGMAHGDLSRKEMRQQARDIADSVIDAAEVNTNPMYEEYANLRKELRTEKVTLKGLGVEPSGTIDEKVERWKQEKERRTEERTPAVSPLIRHSIHTPYRQISVHFVLYREGFLCYTGENERQRSANDGIQQVRRRSSGGRRDRGLLSAEDRLGADDGGGQALSEPDSSGSKRHGRWRDLGLRGTRGRGRRGQCHQAAGARGGISRRAAAGG